MHHTRLRFSTQDSSSIALTTILHWRTCNPGMQLTSRPLHFDCQESEDKCGGEMEVEKNLNTEHRIQKH
eukprot:13340565-Alexandrium_andersonii.AAC.1